MKTNTTSIHTYIQNKTGSSEITGKHNLHFHTKHKLKQCIYNS